MRRFFKNAGFMVLLLLVIASDRSCLGAAQSAQQTTAPPILLDRVIAVINGEVLLESDLEEEMHYALLQPYTAPAGPNDRLRALRRLINRTLILQQINELNMQDVQPNESDVAQRIAEMKRQIPACVHLDCQTEKGWETFLRENHFTLEQVEAYWAQRLEILNFIEQRFRSGIHIPSEDVEKYYQENLVPQFTKVNARPPDLKSVSGRIEEILLQQKVNDLLQDWLKSLRERGGVDILDPEFKSLASPDDSDGEGD